jgi:hypothetical protein
MTHDMNAYRARASFAVGLLGNTISARSSLPAAMMNIEDADGVHGEIDDGDDSESIDGD